MLKAGAIPEELAGHRLPEALGPPGHDHIEGAVGGPPDALHAQAIQRSIGCPKDSSHSRRAPHWPHAHACTDDQIRVRQTCHAVPSKVQYFGY